MTARTAVRLALMPAMMLLAWFAWEQGGILLAWAGLDALDVPGRVCAVFAALGLADAALVRFAARAGHGGDHG